MIEMPNPAAAIETGGPYDDLVARVRARLPELCRHLAGTVEVDLDLGDIADRNASVVTGLLSGDSLAFRSEYVVPGFETGEASLSDDIGEGIEQGLRELLQKKEFAADVRRVANLLGVDEEALKSQILADERLDWTHYAVGPELDLTLTGDIDVSASTGLVAGIRPGERLFRLLETMRVSPDSFLDSLRHYCMCRRWTAAQAAYLDIETDGYPMDTPLFDIYREAFLQSSMKSQATLLLPHEFRGPPVVDVDDLVHSLIMTWPPGSVLYAHTTVKAQSLYDFGCKIGGAFSIAERDCMHAGIQGGLATSEVSEECESFLKMKAPLYVDLCELTVARGQLTQSLGGGLILDDVAQAKADAYEALEGVRHLVVTAPSTDSEWAALLDCLEEIVKRSSPFVADQLVALRDDSAADPVCRMALGRLKDRLASERRQRELPYVLGRDLLAAMGPGNDADDAMHERVKWLLQEGADAECSTSHGIMPVHLAAQQCDAVLLRDLANAGADLNALRTGARGAPIANGSQNALTIAIDQVLREEATYPSSHLDAVVELMLGAGAWYPPCPLAIGNRWFSDHLEAALYSGSERLLREALRRMNPAEIAADQDLIDRAFLGQAVALHGTNCAILLDGGANPNRSVETQGYPLCLEDAILIRLGVRYSTNEAYLNIRQMILAKRAKNSMAAVIGRVRVPVAGRR